MEFRKSIFLVFFLAAFSLCVVQVPVAAAGKEHPVTVEVEEDVYMKVVLRYGTKGEDVKLLQSYLKRAGFYRDTIDGAFGNATLHGVKVFQQTVGLQPDGIVGPTTLKALRGYNPVSRGEASRSVITEAATGKTESNVPDAIATANRTTTAGKAVQVTNDTPKAERKKGKKLSEPAIKEEETATNVMATVQQPQPTGPSRTETKPSAGIPASWKPIWLEATAYTRHDEGCTNFTYRGNYLQRGLVAVDPKVVPLGTKLFIPGYGYAIADDIGGAIQGNRIDLAMDTLDEAFAFGRKQMTAYIIDWTHAI